MIAFEPLRTEDLPRLRRWLERPHVRRWWRDSLDESIAGYEQAIAGLDPTDHYLIVLDGRRVGMIETYLVFAEPAVHACVASVDEENRPSWRAFEKAGFRHVRDVEEEGRPHRLMRHDRRYAQ